jgi:hypothetical protein
VVDAQLAISLQAHKDAIAASLQEAKRNHNVGDHGKSNAAVRQVAAVVRRAHAGVRSRGSCSELGPFEVTLEFMQNQVGILAQIADELEAHTTAIMPDTPDSDPAEARLLASEAFQTTIQPVWSKDVPQNGRDALDRAWDALLAGG